MPSANDVARYIEDRLGSLSSNKPAPQLSALKLQKLLYYVQAWSLAWTQKPLFADSISAWPSGPVVGSVRQLRKDGDDGDASTLPAADCATVDAVLTFYGTLDAEQLIGLSHREPPWRDAREGLAPTERSDREISQASMQAYYEPLATEGALQIPEDVIRGVAFMLALPEDEIDRVGEVDESVSIDDACRWLDTGEGNPWTASLG